MYSVHLNITYKYFTGNEDFAEEKLALMLSKDNPYLSRINKELSKYNCCNELKIYRLPTL